MSPEAIQEAAGILATLRTTPAFRLDRLPPSCRPAGEAEGYRVNDALQERLTAAGYGPVCGYKLGCTTPLMQQRIGLDHPTAGCVATDEGTVVRLMRWLTPGAHPMISLASG